MEALSILDKNGILVSYSLAVMHNWRKDGLPLWKTTL
jgi:hypothetical protein